MLPESGFAMPVGVVFARQGLSHNLLKYRS